MTGLRAGWGRAVLCAAAAAVAAFVPQHAGLDPAGRRALFILVLAAGLWVTEAMPAFAVGLLVIALEIALLGRPDGVFARSPDDWEMFVRPWGSPVIWLFFGLVGGWYSSVRHHRPELTIRMTLRDVLIVAGIVVGYAFVALPLWLTYKGF